ncbi:zinc-ribbon domain-containing protein [Salinibacterium sp. ZJ450]|uniref:zinc-ribbon domain-containing protein n=1 Tax=Salinibacterium sp. ZJ450 TaxID=2708338 RepID=UPI001421A893|nr:zinc-ribbon domain-containing protein [Salinibacterium sp. ZJ450]
MGDLITAPAFQQKLFDPHLTFRDAYAELVDSIDETIGPHPALVDGLWLWIRPDFATIRDKLLGWDQPHRSYQVCRSAIDLKDVTRPLEPFERYIECLRTSLGNEWLECIALFVAESDAPTRLRTRSTSATALLNLCPRGHTTLRQPSFVAESFKNQMPGCSICAGDKKLRGCNTLVDLHPAVAARWHPEKNKSVDIHAVALSDKTTWYWWLCPQNHSYRGTVFAEIVRQVCPTCEAHAPGRVTPERNLAAYYPDIAAELYWAPGEDLAPATIAPNSKKWLWWRCSQEHFFYQEVRARVRGTGCEYCAGRATLPGFNDLASMSLGLANEWDCPMNGMPADLAGPGLGGLHFWRCQRNHSFYESIPARERGAGCPYCDDRLVLPGFNDIATRHPDWVEKWHVGLNLGLEPYEVLAAGGVRLWWCCAHGHPYPKSVKQMTANSNCPICDHEEGFEMFTLAARYPFIILDWDFEANMGLSPAEILPGNQGRFWTCEVGHTRYAKATNRLRTHGCPDCPVRLRAGQRRSPSAARVLPWTYKDEGAGSGGIPSERFEVLALRLRSRR